MIISLCNTCYSPRIDENSIKYNGDFYCSFECLEKRVKLETGRGFSQDLVSEIDELEEKIDDLNFTINDMESYIDEANRQYKLIKELYYIIEKGYRTDDVEKMEDAISSAIEFYNDNGIELG